MLATDVTLRIHTVCIIGVSLVFVNRSYVIHHRNSLERRKVSMHNAEVNRSSIWCCVWKTVGIAIIRSHINIGLKIHCYYLADTQSVTTSTVSNRNLPPVAAISPGNSVNVLTFLFKKTLFQFQFDILPSSAIGRLESRR